MILDNRQRNLICELYSSRHLSVGIVRFREISRTYYSMTVIFRRWKIHPTIQILFNLAKDSCRSVIQQGIYSVLYEGISTPSTHMGSCLIFPQKTTMSKSLESTCHTPFEHFNLSILFPYLTSTPVANLFAKN